MDRPLYGLNLQPSSYQPRSLIHSVLLVDEKKKKKQEALFGFSSCPFRKTRFVFNDLFETSLN